MMGMLAYSPAAQRGCSNGFSAALGRYLGFFAALALVTFACSSSFAADAAASSPKIALRVIYFGHPQSARAKDFVGLLQQHFTKVGQGDLDTFRESDAAGYAVTILDYDELKVVKNRIEMPKKIVSRQFAHPTITIGATGALICQQLGLKRGYL